jgi:hypothetical protein
MKRNALFAAVIALPVIAAAQESDTTGSITPIDPGSILTEQQARSRLVRAGYSAIGTLSRDSDGIWRTTAMKGDTMMSVSIAEDGTIEDR